MKVKIINKPFLGIISATRISSKRRRAMVSRLPIRFAFFAISAILLLSGFLAIHSNQSAWAGTFPGPNGQIAFSSNRDGNYEIYVMNADDGSDVTRLTDDDADDREPDWGTNTSTPGDDNGDDDNKNKHDSKKKHHDDNAKKKH